MFRGTLRAALAALVLSSGSAWADDQVIPLEHGQPIITEETFACDDCCPEQAGCGCQSDCLCQNGKPWFDPSSRGLFIPSDPCFPSFIFPTTNTVLWEDPRNITGIRFLFIQHNFPGDSVFAGGDAQVVAAQARVGLTERLSFIATKDGYIDINSDIEALDNDGAANIAAGLKYTLFRDVERRMIAAGGMTFEIPLGTERVFQGQGDGDFHFFLSGAAELTDCANWQSGTGFRVPVDSGAGTTMWYWSNHLDVELYSNTVFAFAEVNWYHWLSDGDGPISGFEGGDLINLGSTDVSGNSIVTLGVGPAVKLGERFQLSAAYELPLTEREDILEERYTVTLLLNY